MTYNLVSIKRVIAKIYTDLGLQESDVPVSDIVEWVAEGLEKIGAPTVLTTKITGKEGIPLTEISNFQAQLPLDYHSIMQVAYSESATSGNFSPMKYASGSFEERQGMTSDIENTFISDSTAATSYVTTDDLIDLVVRLYGDTIEEAIARLNSYPEIESVLQSLIGIPADSSLSYDRGTVNTEQLEYVLTPGYIKTNARTGYLMIAYKAVATDEDGYPMIPDSASFMEALYWYVNMKIKYMQWSQGKIRDAVYQHAEQKWNFYARQAYGKAMMPATLDEMESIKNVWMRLLPVTNAADSFFSYIDQQESLRNYR